MEVLVLVLRSARVRAGSGWGGLLGMYHSAVHNTLPLTLFSLVFFFSSLFLSYMG